MSVLRVMKLLEVGMLLFVLGLASVTTEAAEKETGDKQSLKAVADTGDEDDETPLCKAAKKGDTEEVKTLIAAGADVNARDGFGKTPLHGAVIHKLEFYRLVRPGTVKALIAAGADVGAIGYVYDRLLGLKRAGKFDGYDKQRMARVEAVEKLLRDARGRE